MTSIVVATVFSPMIVISLTVTISAFAQAKSMTESINNSGILANGTTQIWLNQQIKLLDRFNKMSNQTGEANKVNANDSGSNSTDITENIRKNLTEVAKKTWWSYLQKTTSFNKVIYILS